MVVAVEVVVVVWVSFLGVVLTVVADGFWVVFKGGAVVVV